MTAEREPTIGAIVRQHARFIYDKNREALDRGCLSIWTVYDHPLDHPDGFIARRFETGNARPISVATSDTVTGDLMTIRKSMATCGLYCMARDPSDDPKIVESWL